MMPCSLMESANSRSASAGKSLRGCSADGWIRLSGIRSTRSRGSTDGIGAVTVAASAVAPGFVVVGVPPSRAPNPRPKADLGMARECRSPKKMSSFEYRSRVEACQKSFRPSTLSARPLYAPGVSRKSAKIAELIEQCRGHALDAHYLGY